MHEIFINYRTEDEPFGAALIDRELSAVFGSDRLFRAPKSIRPGDDFAERIPGAVRRSSVLLVVIGPRWVEAADPTGRRRLDDPTDWVRREIAEALRYRVRIIPVLCHNVSMPKPADLPRDIAALARCQYLHLHHRNVQYDIKRLVDELTSLAPELASLVGSAPASAGDGSSRNVSSRAVEVSDLRDNAPMPEALPMQSARLAALGRRWRHPLAIIVLAVVAIVGLWKATSDGRPASEYRINVTADIDKLVTIPQIAAIGGSYVTSLPIAEVPPPPRMRDSCANRYEWAHQAPISAVDADTSIAKVDITPLKGAVTITGARPHYDNNKAAPLTNTLLTCAGKGGSRPPHLLEIDLDSGQLVFYPDGGDTPGTLNLDIARGETESLLIVGKTLDCYCRWRLELELTSDDGQRHAVTIGPAGAAFDTASQNSGQQPFETTGSLSSSPYRFRDGQWRSGR